MIKDWRPVVVVEERHRQGAVAAVADFFDGFFLDGRRFNSLREFDVSCDQSATAPYDAVKVGRYINDFIFIHHSRSADRAAAARLSGRDRSPSLPIG